MSALCPNVGEAQRRYQEKSLAIKPVEERGGKFIHLSLTVCLHRAPSYHARASGWVMEEWQYIKNKYK